LVNFHKAEHVLLLPVLGRRFDAVRIDIAHFFQFVQFETVEYLAGIFLKIEFRGFLVLQRV
jgi:hypothetical protein